MKQDPPDERQRLIDLGPERLADALLALAHGHPRVEAMVTRLTATPSAGLNRVRAKLARLGQGIRFVSRSEAAEYAEDLRDVLADIQAGAADPRTVVELVAEFFRADGAVLGACDDSNGHVGGVFRYEGQALFTAYAVSCPEKEWLAGLVLELVLEDGYGVRAGLIDSAAQYLPVATTRRLAEGLWSSVVGGRDDGGRAHAGILLEALARQLRDPALFERVRLTRCQGVSPAACKDIAAAYLDADDAATALSWLQRMPPETGYLVREFDQLLLRAQQALGNRDEQSRIAWRLLRADRSLGALEGLLAIIGQERRDEVAAGEAAAILASRELVLNDAQFLIDTGRLQDCAQYLFARRDQLDGDLYHWLVPLAEAMEHGGEALAASLVYRALLDSILARGLSRYYHHGARYLARLDALSASVPDWLGVTSHAAYTAGLRQVHARKAAFWARLQQSSQRPPDHATTGNGASSAAGRGRAPRW